MKKTLQILSWGGAILVALISVYLLVMSRNRTPTIGMLIDPLLPQTTPTIYPSAATVIVGVQTISRLETASYHIEKVITAESGQGPLGFLFGDKLLLIAHGQVIAGVDLSQIGPQDLLITDEGTVYMRMPPVEIFLTTLDNSRTYVYDRRTGVGGMNPQLETAARQEAERLILQTAVEDGIEHKATESARNFLRSFILSMGFKHLIFVEELPTPTPAPPTPTLEVTITTP